MGKGKVRGRIGAEKKGKTENGRRAKLYRGAGQWSADISATDSSARSEKRAGIIEEGREERSEVQKSEVQRTGIWHQMRCDRCTSLTKAN